MTTGERRLTQSGRKGRKDGRFGGTIPLPSSKLVILDKHQRAPSLEKWLRKRMGPAGDKGGRRSQTAEKKGEGSSVWQIYIKAVAVPSSSVSSM